MAGTLGTIRGQMILDVKQTLAAYTSARAAHVSTVTALHTGAGALTMLGAGMAAAGVGLASGLLVAVGAAAQFEKKLDYFGAVSNATQKEYEAISAKALQLGQDSIYSANEIADSFIELGKSGVSAKGIIDGIGEAVTNLGQATDLPLADAAQSLTTILNTFGLQATDAVAVVDKLAGAANSSSIDVTDLITTMTYAGASAKVAGLSFDDVNTAIAVLGERGIKGSKAGTGLRQMFDKLIAPTKGGTAALKELGIITDDGTNSLLNMDGSLKSIPTLLDTLNGALGGLNASEKMDLLGSIFPITSLPTILNLLDGGSAAMSRLNGEISKTTAMEIAGKRLDNLSGDVEILRGNIETMLITAGGPFQEFARSLVQGVTGIIQAFANLPSGVISAILIFTTIMGIVLIIVGVFGMFAGAVLNIIALAIQLAPVWAAMGKVLGIVSGAFRALGVAMMANPIGIIIGLVALLVAALVWFFTQTELGRDMWSNFMSFLSDTWNNIVSIATTVWTSLVTFFTSLWDNLSSFFATWGPTILAVIAPFIGIPLLIATHWDSIVAFFTTVWTNITNSVSTFVTGVVAFFMAMPGQILAFITGLPAQIGYVFGFVLGTVVRILMELAAWLLINVPLIITNIVTFFQELPGKIGAFFQGMFDAAVLWLANLILQAMILAPQILANIVNFLQELPGKIGTFFSDMYNQAVSWLANMLAQAITLAAQIVSGIIGFISGLPAQVGAFFSQVATNVLTFMGEALANAKRIASDIKNGIISGIEGIPGLVSGIFNKVVDAVKGVITSAANAVKNFAAGMWEGFKDGLGIHSPSYIEHAMWAITGVVDEETRGLAKQVKVIQGLGNGISEVGNNIGNGFGSSLDKELISLQAQLKSASGLQAQFSTGTIDSPAGVEARQTTAAIDQLNRAIAVIAEKETFNVEKIEISNAKQETASQSLPKAVRATTFMLG